LTRYRPPAEIAAGPLLDNGKWHGDAPTGETAVRNDTGVYEGGEISMFYDPMIAKLCTWAPTRGEAIERMRVALDSFEVEGIGHNLPFLSAVMDHPIFIDGTMTTAFIENEYPDGFEGVELAESELRRIAAATAAMHRVAEIRRARVSGRMDNHERKVGSVWNVALQDHSFDVTIAADQEGASVTFEGGETLRVSGAWTPGDQLATMTVSDAPLILKVGKISGGFRIRTRGADMKVHVRTPLQAEMARKMPVKVPPDTSKLLLCPMPGLIVKLDVAVGDEVQDGQALCTIEAMKMENILRAERKGIVTKINAGAGDSLAVDDVIMEFE
jgi:propionyl-CoA carboxylase alpha chain